MSLNWHKTSATLGQACVADISKVSSVYYKNSLFHWHSKNVLQMSSPALQAHLDPVSSEISDLCEISDLFLFVSYFASQNKEIKFDNYFLTCITFWLDVRYPQQAIVQE